MLCHIYLTGSPLHQNLCIQSEYGKIGTRKTSVFRHFLHSAPFYWKNIRIKILTSSILGEVEGFSEEINFHKENVKTPLVQPLKK